MAAARLALTGCGPRTRAWRAQAYEEVWQSGRRTKRTLLATMTFTGAASSR
jgi:CO/xanthine dehydrogenase FAD-binding subunit